MPRVIDKKDHLIQAFVLHQLAALSVSVEMVADGLYRAEFTPEQLAAVEDRPVPVWGPQADQRSTIYLAFDARAAQTKPEAELIRLGSQRLEQLMKLARRQGRFTRQTVPWEENFSISPELWTARSLHARGAPAMIGVEQVYGSFLLFDFSVECCADGSDLRTVYCLVDLHRKTAVHLPNLSVSELAGWSTQPGSWPDELPSQCTLEAAYDLATTCVRDVMAQSDRQWAHRAYEQLEMEIAELRAYYQRLAAEVKDPELTAEQERRESELRRRAAPCVVVRAAAAARLSLPLLRVELTGGQIAWLNPLMHPFMASQP